MKNYRLILGLITIAKNHHTDRYRKSKQYKEISQEVEEDKITEFSKTVRSPEELMIANQNLEKDIILY